MEIGDPIDAVEVGSAVLSTSSVRRVKPTLRTCMGLIVLLGSLQSAEEVSQSLVNVRSDAGQEIFARNLQLRGGGRHHKAKEKAVYQDKVLKSIAKERKERKINKVRFRPGTTGFIPFNGPFLYAIGGRSTKFELASVYKFDLTTGKWTPAPSLDAPRAAFGAARAHGRIYVMGGTADFEPLASVRSFMPYDSSAWSNTSISGGQGSESAAWRIEAPLPFPRRFFAAASWKRAEATGGGVECSGRDDEAVFVLGGSGRFHFTDSAINAASYASVQSYDAASRTWLNHTDMPGGRRHHAAAVYNGRIYVLGGWRGVREQRQLDAGLAGGGGGGGEGGTAGKGDGGCDEVLAEVASYDPVTREWRQEAAMPTARRCLAAVCCNGRIYALGGVQAGSQLATVESLDPTKGTWRKEPDLLQPRSGFGAAAYNGCIYVGGGVVGGSDLKAVEVFDPLQASWQLDVSLPARRWGLQFLTV
jgi:hypothetical protein